MKIRWKSLEIRLPAGYYFADPAVRESILGLVARGLVKPWCIRLSSRASESRGETELLSTRLLVFLAARLTAESGSVVAVFRDAAPGYFWELGHVSMIFVRNLPILCSFVPLRRAEPGRLGYLVKLGVSR